MRFYDPFFGSFDFQGTLKGTSVSGTASMAVPLLNKDGSAQSCSSGDVGWKAAAPPAGAPQGGGAMHVTRTIHVTQSASGRVVWSTSGA